METSASHGQHRVPGVLGGMGPEATVDFLSRVLAATGASSDQEHIHLIIDHNPRIPNRHAAIAGEAPGIGPALAAMAVRLETAGADFLVMVCNTAHAYATDIQAAVAIPFISIVDVVMDALRETGGSGPVGIMAADGCLQANLYQRALATAGYDAVLWTESERRDFMRLVYRIKAGDRSSDVGAGVGRLAHALATRGATTLVAACTEIPLVFGEADAPCPVLSSTDLLARRTIALARTELSLEDTP